MPPKIALLFRFRLVMGRSKYFVRSCLDVLGTMVIANCPDEFFKTTGDYGDEHQMFPKNQSNFIQLLQGGPLLVINGVITPINGLITG